MSLDVGRIVASAADPMHPSGSAERPPRGDLEGPEQMEGPSTPRAPPSGFRAPPARLRHIIAGTGILFFILIVLDVHFDGALTRFNLIVSSWVMEHVSASLRDFFHRIVSAPGHNEVAAVIGLAAVVFVTWNGRWRTGIFVFASGTLAALVWWTLKAYFDRARPDMILEGEALLGRTAAFPSGHTMKAMVATGLLLYFGLYAWVSRTRSDPSRFIIPVTALWIGVVTMVSAARILSGQHWPTDVLASWGLAAAWLSLTVTLHEKWIRPFEQLAVGRRPTNDAVL
jgi:membrane-associated phospholipid phosphatase